MPPLRTWTWRHSRYPSRALLKDLGRDRDVVAVLVSRKVSVIVCMSRSRSLHPCRTELTRVPPTYSTRNWIPSVRCDASMKSSSNSIRNCCTLRLERFNGLRARASRAKFGKIPYCPVAIWRLRKLAMPLIVPLARFGRVAALAVVDEGDDRFGGNIPKDPGGELGGQIFKNSPVTRPDPALKPCGDQSRDGLAHDTTAEFGSNLSDDAPDLTLRRVLAIPGGVHAKGLPHAL